MNLFYFFAGLAITVGSGRYLYQNRKDKVSVMIYGLILIAAVCVTAVSGISIMPDRILNDIAPWIQIGINFIIIMILIDILRREHRQRTEQKKYKRILVYSLCVLAVFSNIASIKTEIQDIKEAKEQATAQKEHENGEIALAYAKQQLMQEKKIQEKDISGSAFSYVRGASYYVVGFTYQKSGNPSKQSYGYHVKIKDNADCKILKQGQKLGEKIIQ